MVEHAEKRTFKDVLFNHAVLGNIIITLVCCIIFFSQEWNFGAFFLVIPGCLACITFFFKVTEILKPNVNVPGLAMFQHPFGDEEYMHGVFFTGYVVEFVLAIALGYEAKLSPHFFAPLFKIFMFMITLVFVSCFHVAVNKAWLTARIELHIKVPPEPGTPIEDDEDSFIVTIPKTKTHHIWTPAQQRFERFTIINMLVYAFLLVMNILDLVSVVQVNLIPLELPGMNGSGNPTGSLTLANVASLVIAPLFFTVVTRKLYLEIYDYKVEGLSSVLVKLEPDDVMREKIVKFLEKIQEYRKAGVL